MTKTVTFVDRYPPYITTEGDIYQPCVHYPLGEPVNIPKDLRPIYHGWQGIEPLQQAWGVMIYSTYLRCSHLHERILDCIPTPNGDAWDYVAGFDIAPSTEDPSMLALWPSREARNQGESKRLRGRPGKMIRRILPGLPDHRVEELVNWSKENILIDPGSFSYKQGTSAEDFVHAYTQDSVTEAGFCTTPDRKSMANSCMRHPAGTFANADGKTHPVEAYASGDFEIHWLENPAGRIVARTVVHPSSGTRGPLYGTSDTALNYLQGQVNFPRGNATHWDGAKIRRLPHNGGMIAPYFDIGHGLIDRDTHLELTAQEQGYNVSEYSGLQTHQNSCTCDCCGDHFPGDEGAQLHDGVVYCPNCTDNCTYYCEHSEDCFDGECDPAKEVHVDVRGRTEQWGPPATVRYATWVSELDEYWANDLLNDDGYPIHLVLEEESEDESA